jgi:hypothetical protein
VADEAFTTAPIINATKINSINDFFNERLKLIEASYQKNIVPDMVMVESIIRKYEIPVVMVYGKKDGLFPLQTGAHFLVDYPYKTTYNLDFGHFMIIPALDEALTKQA